MVLKKCKLSHPNIGEIYYLGVHGDICPVVYWKKINCVGMSALSIEKDFIDCDEKLENVEEILEAMNKINHTDIHTVYLRNKK